MELTYANYISITIIYTICINIFSVKGWGSERRGTTVHVRGTRNRFRFNNQLLLRTDEGPLPVLQGAQSSGRRKMLVSLGAEAKKLLQSMSSSQTPNAAPHVKAWVGGLLIPHQGSKLSCSLPHLPPVLDSLFRMVSRVGPFRTCT